MIDAQVKHRNLCNCPNCQTDDCPAGVELAVLKRELISMTLDRDERAKQKSDFFVAIAQLQAELAECREQLRMANQCACALAIAADELWFARSESERDWSPLMRAVAANKTRVKEVGLCTVDSLAELDAEIDRQERAGAAP